MALLCKHKQEIVNFFLSYILNIHFRSNVDFHETAVWRMVQVELFSIFKIRGANSCFHSPFFKHTVMLSFPVVPSLPHSWFNPTHWKKLALSYCVICSIWHFAARNRWGGLNWIWISFLCDNTVLFYPNSP